MNKLSIGFILCEESKPAPLFPPLTAVLERSTEAELNAVRLRGCAVFRLGSINKERDVTASASVV